MIQVKRIYEEPNPSDGVRILVDRVWPRGMSRERARIDDWRKDLAPSDALRKWFGHDPAKWDAFRTRYRDELTKAGRIEALRELATLARQSALTLVYSATDQEHNQAVALKEILEALATARRGAKRTGFRSEKPKRETKG